VAGYNAQLKCVYTTGGVLATSPNENCSYGCHC